ncbi:hypothetical protein QL285_079505 [Trifolium repens]|nr:hypothetical protein QL285_079505 [Trifolium repens]
MAPKKVTTKRAKQSTGQGSSSRANIDPLRFLGHLQYARFKDLETRTIWGENVFRIEGIGAFTRFKEIIEERNWGVLACPIEDINFDLVKEFYANDIPLDDEDPVSFKTMVRGQEIRFDRDAINEYLGQPSNLSTDTYCAYTQSVARGNWNVSAITQTLLEPGRQLVWNQQNTHPVRAMKEDLTIPSQLLLLFTLHNVIPRSHTSDAIMRVLQFMYYMENNLEIDVARVIANEMREMVLTGTRPTKLKGNSALGFPGLIMGLIKEQGQLTTSDVDLTLKEFDDAEARRLCRHMRTTVFIDPAGNQSSVPPPTNPTTFPPTGYPPMDPLTFHNMVSYNWDLHDAGYRAMQAVHQSIYNTQIMQPVMTPEQFTAYVQWPGDRPFIPGGGSSSGTGAGANTGAGADVGGGADTFNDIDDFGIDDETTLRQAMDTIVNGDGSDEEMANEDSLSDEF